MRRVVIRAFALVFLGAAAIVALTLYFSSEHAPPCLVSGVGKWRPPGDKSLHRFELVVPDRALCFFDMDNGQVPAGYLPLPHIEGVSAIAARGPRLALRYDGNRGAEVDLRTGDVSYGRRPPPAPTGRVDVADPAAGLAYETRPGKFGFRIFRLDSRLPLAFVTFTGFTWNPRFGPDPPDHGLSLAPDRPELWVLDAPNNVIHVFDVSGTRPDPVANLRLTKPLTGEENPCARPRCTRLGWLQHSADGRFVYVGDSGDVFDTSRHEEVANVEALHQSRLLLEVDWVGGAPEFPAASR